MPYSYTSGHDGVTNVRAYSTKYSIDNEHFNMILTQKCMDSW